MGRELKRKQAKRDGKNVKDVQKKNVEQPLKPKTFIILLVVLFLFFVILYILSGLFITKEIKWFNTNSENETIKEVENKILAIESLKQSEEEYYVYFYDTTEENSDVSSKVRMLSGKVYRVDLNDGFNSNFIGEPSGIVDNINDLKVSNPTIIKVVSEKIIEFHSGIEEIKLALD